MPRAIGPFRRRVVVICGLAAAIIATTLAVVRPSPLMREDYRVYDSFVRFGGPVSGTSGIAIVDIDERSLSEIGQWPWRRDVIGRLIDRARELGATAVALDILMAEPDRFARSIDAHDARRDEDPMPAAGPDAALADTIGRGRIVLGYAMTFARDARQSGACLSHPLPLVVSQSPSEREDTALFRASGAVCNLPQLERAAAGSGFLNAVPDADGILRRVPLVMEYDGRVYPALGLAAVMAATGARPGSLQMRNAAAGALIVDDQPIPVDGRGNLLLRYRGQKNAFLYVSAVDVLRGEASAQALRGTLVFVGATALGVKDVVTTPLDTLVAGVEVHATVADNLLRRDFLSRPDYALLLEAAAVFLLAIGVTLVCIWRGVAASAVLSFACLIFIWGATFWAFSSGRVFVSPVLPTLGVVLAFGAVSTAAYAREHSKAERASVDLLRSQRLVIQSLLSLTETRDADTGRHSRRTQTFARLLAEQLSTHPRFRDYLTRERVDMLASLAPLHDIGKVGVPDRVLQKPTTLTADEYAEIQKHPSHGRDVIVRAERQVGAEDDPVLMMAKEIVLTHHERWDGHGYPQGLREEEIPIAGRIVAIVDVYDALVTRRVYRDPLPFDEAVTLITERRGTHFDPAVVDAFLRAAPALHDLSKATSA